MLISGPDEIDSDEVEQPMGGNEAYRDSMDYSEAN